MDSAPGLSVPVSCWRLLALAMPGLRMQKKGWRMPPKTVKVDRTTKWGNPFVVGKNDTQEHCVYLFRAMMSGYICLSNGPSIETQENYLKMARESRKELKGKNLACWCRPGTPCHADVLLHLKQ